MEVLSSRILLHPADLAESRRFYEELLGLAVYREYGVAGRVTGVVLFLGGGFLELATAGGMPGAHTGPSLWLQVRDLDATHAELVHVGVPVDEPPAVMPWGLREMSTHDPDGIRIVLVEVPEEHPLRRRL